jgi:ribosomal protein S12 methylthiotransferase accessory factor
VFPVSPHEECVQGIILDSLDLELPKGSPLENVLPYIQDVFCIDLPYAPGMVFAGARFSPASGSRNSSMSAGAADTSRQMAFERCLGEIAETLSQFQAFQSDDLIIHPSITGSDPGDTALFEEAYGVGIAEAGWIKGQEVLSQSECYVPASTCFRALGGSSKPEKPFSSGFAAGTTLTAAIEAATLELVERDAIALWWHGGRPPRRIEAPSVKGAQDILNSMRGGRSERQTVLLDLTTGLDVPVVAAVSSNRDGNDLAFGYAARLTWHMAVEAALKELAQMELGNFLADLKERSGKGDHLTAQEIKLLERRDILNLQSPPFICSPNCPSASHEEPETALDAVLAGNGVQRFIVDVTSPRLGVPAARVICPQLQPLPIIQKGSRLICAQKLYNRWPDTVLMCEPI